MFVTLTRNFNALQLYYAVIFLLDAISTQQIPKYCREKERLIASEEIDEYLLVDVEYNSSLLLQCHFCDWNGKEDTDIQQKLWYKQDRYQLEPQVQLDLQIDDNVINQIFITPEMALVIRNFGEQDAGVYRCHGKDGQDEDLKFNYRVEPIFKDFGHDLTIERGNLTDWEKYRETYLIPITTRFAVSRMTDLVEIREEGLILSVITEWSPWGVCENCVKNTGLRTRLGRCRVKRVTNQTFDLEGISSFEISPIVQFFQSSPVLPCRSVLLDNEFSAISRAVRYIPEFILEEKCKNCPKVRKRKKKAGFKYHKRFVLSENDHLTISCPESNLDTQVVWRKNGIVLPKGTGTISIGQKDTEPRILVDTFWTLYLREVSELEAGNYTCYVNGVNMWQVDIIVISRSRLLTQAFFRHMGYLGFIFILSFICYCSGLFLICKTKKNVTRSEE